MGGALGTSLLNACGLSWDGATESPENTEMISTRPAITSTSDTIPTSSFSPTSQKVDNPDLKGIVVFPNERRMKKGSYLPAAYPSEAWFSIEDVQRMKKGGATCIEMHQLWFPELMPERDFPSESYFAKWVDVWVDWCTQNRLYCILNITGLGAFADWAFYTSMPSWLWDGLYPAPDWKDKAACDAIIRDFFDLDVAKQNENRAAFINLWKFIASRYKNNPYVIFSIMNEPFWDVTVPDEETAILLGRSYSTFMEQIVDGIRSTHANQKVFIDLPFLRNKDWQFTVQPVNRDNIVWEAHMYGNIWEPDNKTFKAVVDSLVRLFVDDYKKPLFIGEFGFNPISSIRTKNGSDWKVMLKDMVDYMDSLPLLGRQFVAWDYMSGELENNSVVSDLTFEESEWTMNTVLS